jgi:ATP-dependent protease ClpP protease subunit
VSALRIRAFVDRRRIEFFTSVGADGESAAMFSAKLAECAGEPLTLYVNSDGGDMYDGATMFYQLATYPGHKTAVITGIAASAASYLIMAADEIQIAPHASLMIHNAWCCAEGDHRWFRKCADDLERHTENMASAYARRTGLDVADVRRMMDDETFLNAQRAVELKFCDRIACVGDMHSVPMAKAKAASPENLRLRIAAKARPEQTRDAFQDELAAQLRRNISVLEG